MATNKVYCSYQEVVDLHTESDRVTVIGVHTPVGDVPSKMFRGFFEQFKKMKYLGCNIKMVPAARLPADPLQVSYAAGEPTLDPRDMMNPIMFHGCHGDDMGTILNRLYGDDAGVSGSIDGIDYDKDWESASSIPEAAMADQLERIYYKALTDRTWKKAHPQRGFQKNGLRPLIYNLAATRQLGFGSDAMNNNGDFYFQGNGALALAGGDPTSDADFDGTDKDFAFKVSKTNVNLITPRLTSLGWIDTRNVVTGGVLGSWIETDLSDLPEAIEQSASRQVNYAEFPKIFMGVILLPPAYKTEQYFRMIINHHFAFAGFRGISFQPEELNVPSYWNKNGDADFLDPTSGQFPEIDPLGGGVIPPEPEPDPPEPEPGVYTYSSVSQLEIGSTVGLNYYNIKDSLGTDCNVLVNLEGVNYALRHLIVNEVPMFDMTNYYFTGAGINLLASNASVGGTYPYYSYDSTNHEMVQAGTVEVISCTPLDYFDVIESGDFTLAQRRGGDERESDLDDC